MIITTLYQVQELIIMNNCVKLGVVMDCLGLTIINHQSSSVLTIIHNYVHPVTWQNYVYF